MTLTETHLDTIKSGLVSGIEQHNRRRVRRRALLAVPALAFIAAGAFVLTDGGSNPAHALTEQPDGTILVEVFPDFSDVVGLQQDLADAGLEAMVVQLRAHPSLEGVVEVSSHDNEAAGALEFQDGSFVIDLGAVEGPLEILVYSATSAGNDYQASPSVFGPGQPFHGLHCAYPDGPLTSADFDARLQEAGITKVNWVTFGPVDPDTGAIESAEHDEQPGGAVVDSQMRNADTLDVFVDLDGEAPAAATISMHDGTHQRTLPECTQELAVRWE